MLYDKKHQRVKTGKNARDGKAGLLLRTEATNPCCQCKRKTHWVSYTWQKAVCSEECSKKLLSELVLV